MIIRIFILVTVALNCHAQFGPGLGFFTSRSSSGISSNTPTGVVIKETFDANPGNSGYDNASWGSSLGAGSSVNPNYTPSIEGAEALQCVRAANVNSELTRTISPSKTEMYGYFQVKIVSSASGTLKIFELQNSSFAAQFTINLTSGRQLTFQSLGSTATTLSQVLTIGTVYHVWYHYKEGSGSNAIGEVYVSSSGTKPPASGTTVYGTTTDGTGTTPLAALGLGQFNGGAVGGASEIIFDRFFLTTADVLSYP